MNQYIQKISQDQSIESLISQAIDKSVPVETMEKLMAMRRELRAEQAKESFDRAMSSFQSECPTIQKTKEVKTREGKTAYRYAPIESIVDQVKEQIKAHGFSYSSNMELIENGTTKVKVTIKVTHEGGHNESTDMTVPLGNQTNIMSQSQVVASAQTFAKRYAFCNAFGILTGDEDTDARPEESHVTAETIVPESECTSCSIKGLLPKVIEYSTKNYGKVLCYKCQQTEEKIAAFNKEINSK